MKSLAAFLAWTALLVAAVIGSTHLATQDTVKSGTAIQFSDNRDIKVEFTVNFQAVSDQYFVLYNKDTGQTITSTPAEPPLGWNKSGYFVAGPEDMAPGTWQWKLGSATVQITSPVATTIRLVRSDKDTVWFSFSIFALIIWAQGLRLANDWGKRRSR